MDKPLITFAVAAFNQERFIREAVEAAFSQTYSPLEIVLSDDCSPDRTFEIMRSMAVAYSGPHRVILNRNSQRRSIGGHVNRVMEVSKGELVLSAAGDDISLPQRTAAMYEAWEQSGRHATSIHSNIIQIDEQGRTIDRIFKGGQPEAKGRIIEQKAEPLAYVRTLEPLVFGCAHAFSRRIFRLFGNLPDEIIHEDNVIAFRSILGGKLVYVDEPLVKYRVHGNNVFIKGNQRTLSLKDLRREEDRLKSQFRNRETMHSAFLSDLQKARLQNSLQGFDFEQTENEARIMQRRFRLQREFLDGGIFRKYKILKILKKEGLNGREYKSLARRMVPLPFLLPIRLGRNCVSRAKALLP